MLILKITLRTDGCSFYSKLVRLDANLLKRARAFFYKFLFQIGAIRRKARIISIHITMFSFYSKLVRLDALERYVSGLSVLFLFQIGAIRSIFILILSGILKSLFLCQWKCYHLPLDSVELKLNQIHNRVFEQSFYTNLSKRQKLLL